MKKEDIKAILKLQSIDEEIDRVRRRLSTIEEELQKLYEELDTARKQVEELSREEAELEKRVRSLRDAIRQEEEMLAKTESKMPLVRKDVEYKTLLREKSRHEDNILKMSYELDELEDSLKDLKARKERLLPDLYKKIKDIEEEIKDIEYEREIAFRRIEELNENRNMGIKDVPAEVLSFYEEAKEHFENRVVCPVEGGVCSGCGMRVPDVLFAKILKEDSIERCPNCGRYIYYSI